jgi:hypothetical protein
VEMSYLAVLHVRLGAEIGNLHAKDSSLFRKRLIQHLMKRYGSSPHPVKHKTGHGRESTCSRLGSQCCNHHHSFFDENTSICHLPIHKFRNYRSTLDEDLCAHLNSLVETSIEHL